MAKHKKKKKPPFDQGDSDKTADSKEDTPPTEKVDNSKEQPQTEEEKSKTKRKLDQLFWIRVGLAVMAGTAATFLFDTIEGEDRRWASIGFMIIIFIVSIGIAKGMRISLPRADRKKLVTTGIGSYIFIYLFMWIITYTLVYVNGNDIGIIPLP